MTGITAAIAIFVICRTVAKTIHMQTSTTVLYKRHRISTPVGEIHYDPSDN